MAESGFVNLPDTCTVAEALRMYSAHKGWCTRYTNKIEKAQPLLDKQYDRRTDELVAENLKKAENYCVLTHTKCWSIPSIFVFRNEACRQNIEKA